MVTLDGDVVNVGGSMTGGSNYNSKSIITTKQELKHREEKKELLIQEQKEISQELTEVNKEISEIEEILFNISKDKVILKESYDKKTTEIKNEEYKLEQITKEWESLVSISNNSISEKEQELIKLFHEKSAEKEQIQIRINALIKEINNLKDKIEQDQARDKVKNSTLRSLEKESRELEININRTDVKLDNMLNTLSEEYELTFEKGKPKHIAILRDKKANSITKALLAKVTPLKRA